MNAAQRQVAADKADRLEPSLKAETHFTIPRRVEG